MNITRCGKEHLVLTTIVAVVSLGGLASVALGAFFEFRAFDHLPILGISLFAFAITLRYRRYRSVPKWMFYLWILPQALYLEVGIRVQDQIQNVIPSFSILGKAYFSLGYQYGDNEREEVFIGVYGLSFLILMPFILFLEEWADEKKKAAEPGATDNPVSAPRI